jgi:hypothetical protein
MLSKYRPVSLLFGLFAGAVGVQAAQLLRDEPSAFLRSNADSPVDWMPWGEAAFARAKSEQKPIFVFVGSFTSELARAMSSQTFANAEASKWLNEQFVCVMVDREERPDLANLYEAYIVRVKQLTGWPLNIWLTPELLPFEGAAYLSPSEEWGRPGFLKEANLAKTEWATDRAACRRRASEAVLQLAPDPSAAPADWSPEKARIRLLASASAWRSSFDDAAAGFTTPPKAPEPELLRFLLVESDADREDALRTLRALSTSAVRDPLDGGFFRYATDAAWRIPYPQKELSDQARIALAFLDAAHGSDQAAFEACARGALDFALSRLKNRDGTFASAIDATGDAFSGYYAWTEAEIDRALGPDSGAFKRAHGVTTGGNVATADDPSAVYASKNLLWSSSVEDAGLAASAARLLALRDGRPPPPRDDRATAGAHGLLLSALARAGTQLNDPRYLDAARKLFATVSRAFFASPDADLRRLVGSAAPGAPDDYAALALGCRDYARATGAKEGDRLAARLLARLDDLFYDPASRHYFSTPASPPAGIFTRTLAAGDPPAPESLVLMAGGADDRAKAISDAQLDSLDEENVQAPGDQLLALALFAGRGSGR